MADTNRAANRSKQSDLYHERQRLQLCALHSLNSMFQKQEFTKKMLDDIVHQYDQSWCWNEYSTLFTGNYDLAILIEAFKRHHYELRAIENLESLTNINFADCFGFLLNIALERPYFDRLPVIRRLTKPARHWLTIKSVNGEEYYNFDSKLSKPELIGDQAAIVEYLKARLGKETYIYMVIPERLA